VQGVLSLNQLTIDFKPRIPTYEKKEERVSFACSGDLKGLIDLMARRQGEDRSVLIHRYVVKGLQDDLAEQFLAEPHLDKTLRKILQEGV
jgi:hypothetical protein